MGYFKINSDGSSKGNSGPASSFAIIRNSDGVWMVGCVRGLRVASNFVAELRGLRDGLLLAKNRRLLPILIETDSMVVYYALSKDNFDVTTSMYNLVEDCRTLINLLGKPPIKHIYREANGVANWMAKNAYNFCSDHNVYEQPPGGILPSLPFDNMGCPQTHLVSS